MARTTHTLSSLVTVTTSYPELPHFSTTIRKCPLPTIFPAKARESFKAKYTFDLTHNLPSGFPHGDQSTPLTLCTRLCLSQMAGLGGLTTKFSSPTGLEFSKGEHPRCLGSSIWHTTVPTLPLLDPPNGAHPTPQATCTLI